MIKTCFTSLSSQGERWFLELANIGGNISEDKSSLWPPKDIGQTKAQFFLQPEVLQTRISRLPRKRFAAAEAPVGWGVHSPLSPGATDARLREKACWFTGACLFRRPVDRVQGRCAACEAVTTSGVRGAGVTAFPARAGALVVGPVCAFVPAQGEVAQRQLWEKVLSTSKGCAP